MIMENLYKKNMYVRIKCVDQINRIVQIVDIVGKELFDYVGVCPFSKQLHWFKEDKVIEIVEDYEQKDV